MQNTTDRHTPALVSRQDFLDRMAQHWSEPPLNMPASPAQLAGWGVMSDHYTTAILNNRQESPRTSFVLPLPTGSGKTEGTCLYAALQADKNLGHSSPVGVLLVTRLIADVDAIAAKVNAFAGRPVAIAHHSKNKQSAQAIASHHVLVITQETFKNAAKSFATDTPDRWRLIHTWDGGARDLIIVDEALANVVDHNEITSRSLEDVLRAIPHELRTRHAPAIGVLEILKAYLDNKEKPDSSSETAKLLWGQGSATHAHQIRELRNALGGVQFALTLYNEDAAQTVDGVLEAVEVMLDGHAYYYRSGIVHSINSSRYLLPEGLPGTVILDATAHHTLLYELLGTSAHIVPVPSNIRDYNNAVLHVARTSAGIGKNKMKETKHLRLPRLAEELAKEIAPGRSVFLCVHQHAAPLAETFSTASVPLQVGWWGAVDGSNAWVGCDVAVIFGLPFQDPRRPINNVFAVNGPQDNTWLQEPPRYNDQANILDIMAQRDVSACVIQAINRISLRRVTDAEGRCAPADVYIVLPKDWRGDAILEDICMSMPGIRVAQWDFEPDGPKAYVPRENSAADAVVEFMRAQQPGLHALPRIGQTLSLSPRQLARIKENLAKPASNITAALRDVGVLYTVDGKGRGAKSYLVKAA